MATSTCTQTWQPIELETVDERLDRRNNTDPNSAEETSGAEETPGGEGHSFPAIEAWNKPKGNSYRLAATFWSFLVTGANDAAYGALIPYLESYYGLNYIVVSIVFFSPFVGYVFSALASNWLHRTVGQRGIGFLCGFCHLVTYVVNSQHPPYPVLVLSFIFAGFGNGIGDAAWNAWVGNLGNANELLGFLHAFYGVGGTIAPLIATSMITEGKLGWYSFYYIMIGLAFVELVVCTWAFWSHDADRYRQTVHPGEEANSSLKTVLFRAPHARVTWISALFLLAYVGTEVSLGGWLVQFMLRVRGAGAFEAGMTSVGFWLGLTVGRVVLGFATPRIGVKLVTACCLALTMALQLVFWLVPHFYVSAVAVALQGFLLGPMFPAVVVVATKLLPRHLHVSCIGFAAAFGGSGAAVLPFAVGSLAQAKGVQVLQPVILSLLGVLLVLWLCLPRLNKRRY